MSPKIISKYIELIAKLTRLWYTITLKATSTGKAEIPRLTTVEAIEEQVNSGFWVADPKWFDSMRHPMRVQTRLDNGVMLGDCDDFASYNLALLAKSGLSTEMWLGVHYYKIQETKETKAHAVAVWRDKDHELHVIDYEDRAIKSLWDWPTLDAYSKEAIPYAAFMIEVNVDSKSRISFGKCITKTYSEPIFNPNSTSQL